jgi:hypothetical protein
MGVKIFKTCVADLLVKLFKENKKFVDVDTYVNKLERLSNVFLISFFDCCREIPPTKGCNDTLFDADTQDMGMSATFYAKCDGEKAAAGDGNLSPTT